MTPSDLTFFERTDLALADANLQLALDRATLRFRANRTNAIAEMLDGKDMRDRARAARAAGLARLDENLDQLQARVEAAQ